MPATRPAILFGRKLGRDFLFRHGPRFRITPNVIARVEAIFEAHGGKAIILGRFIGVARAITPFLAGTSNISLRRFLMFDIPGAAAWAATFLGVGYLVAESASRAAALSHAIGLIIGIAAFAAALAIGLFQLHRTAPRGTRIRFALQVDARRADPREARQRRRAAVGTAAPGRCARAAAQAARTNDRWHEDGGNPSAPGHPQAAQRWMISCCTPRAFSWSTTRRPMPCSCRRSSRAPATRPSRRSPIRCRWPRRCAEQPPDLLLLDWHMPGRSGAEILEEIAFLTDEPNWMPVLVLTADIAPDTKRQALSLGARDFLTKPIDVAEVLLRVRNLLQTRYLRVQLERTNDLLHERVLLRTRELEEAKLEMLYRLALAAEYRDDATGQHAERIGRTSELLALEVGLGEAEANLIGQAARLHDIGKIGIADELLLKPGKYTVRRDGGRCSCTPPSAPASSRAAATSC